MRATGVSLAVARCPSDARVVTETSDPPRYPIGCLAGIALALLNAAFVGVAIETLPAGISGEVAAARGHLTANALMVSMVCAAVAVYAWNRSRKLFAVMAVASVLVPCGPLLLSLRQRDSVEQRRALGITDDERRAPDVVLRGGHTYWVQQALGFEILAADGLTLVSDDRATAQSLDAHPEIAETMATWRWASPSGAQQLVVLATVATVSTDEALRSRFFATNVDAAIAQMRRMGLQIVEDRHVSDRERLVRGVSPANGGVLFVRTISYERAGRFLLVTASGTALAATELDEVIESLRAIP